MRGDSGLPENLTSHVERRDDARATRNEFAVLSISKALPVIDWRRRVARKIVKLRNARTIDAIRPAAEASKFIYSRGPGVHTYIHTHTYMRARARTFCRHRKVTRREEAISRTISGTNRSRQGAIQLAIARRFPSSRFGRRSSDRRSRRDSKLTPRLASTPLLPWTTVLARRHGAD